MTSNTQTSNMSAAKVNAFVKAFMVKAKDSVDDEAYEAILAMWNGDENQTELASSFKVGRKSGSKGKKLKDKNKKQFSTRHTHADVVERAG